MLGAIHNLLNRQSAAAIVALAAVILGGVAAIDWKAGHETSVAVLYLGPVALVTWYVGRGLGIVAALAAAGAVVSVDLATNHIYSLQAIPFWNGLVNLSFYLICVALLDKLHRQLDLEHQLARTDALTGTLNSHAFVEHMGYIIALARRDGAPLTLVYIDLDDFKQINDHHGHSEGNQVLQIVGHTLRHSIRVTDTAAHLGGDEFALLLPATDQVAANILVTKIVDRIHHAAPDAPPPLLAASARSLFPLRPPTWMPRFAWPTQSCTRRRRKARPFPYLK